MQRYFYSGGFDRQGMVKVLDAFHCWEEHRNSPKLMMDAFRYLIDNAERCKETKFYDKMIPSRKELYTTAETYIKRYTQSKQIEYAREVADTLLTYCPEYRDRILKCLEEDEQDKPEKENNVYVNNQNVHDDSITTSMIRAASVLCKMYPIPNEFKPERKELFTTAENTLAMSLPDEEDVIRHAIKYIQENNARFGPERINIAEVFGAVWKWIQDKDYKRPHRELYKRLIEELHEMKGMCSSGHIARLVNVIQGFTDDERLMIRISDKEQCRTVVKTYLNRIFQECTDEKIQNGFIDQNKLFIQFVREKIGDKLLDWKDEYGPEFLRTIGDTVNSYCGCTVFVNRNK